MKALPLLLVLLFTQATIAIPLPPIADADLEQRLRLLTPAPYDGGAELKHIGKRSGCEMFKITYPVRDPYSEKIMTYSFDLSWPVSSKPAPVVISVPTIHGITPMEGAISQQLCGMRVANIVAHVNNEGLELGMEGLELANRQLLRGAVALRTLVDVLEDMPVVTDSPEFSRVLIDTKQIGLIGLSVGSVSSSIAMATDDRFKALYTMGTIGNIPHTLAYSTSGQVKQFRLAQMRNLGLDNPAQYEMMLRQRMTSSPVDFSSLMRNKRVYQIVIENDSVVPTEDQRQYKDMLQNATTFVKYGVLGHIAAITSEILVNKKTLRQFVKENFQP